MTIAPGTKVKLQDGRVGNVTAQDTKGRVFVTAPVEARNDRGRIVAGLEEVVALEDELTLEWTETDVHGRTFDQNGDLVVWGE